MVASILPIPSIAYILSNRRAFRQESMLEGRLPFMASGQHKVTRSSQLEEPPAKVKGFTSGASMLFYGASQIALNSRLNLEICGMRSNSSYAQPSNTSELWELAKGPASIIRPKSSSLS
jgi:hypothetical protein